MCFFLDRIGDGVNGAFLLLDSHQSLKLNFPDEYVFLSPITTSLVHPWEYPNDLIQRFKVAPRPSVMN
jgi:hypothetical protein